MRKFPWTRTLGVALSVLVGCSLQEDGEEIDTGISAATVGGVNGSFETNTNGWVGWNATLQRVALAGAPDGAYVAKVSRTGGTAFTIDDSPPVVTSALASTRYTASVSVRAASTSSVGRPVTITLRERTPSGREVRQSPSRAVSLTNSFQRIEVSATPSGGNALEIYVAQSSAAAGDAFYVDAVRLETDAPSSTDGGTKPEGGTPTDGGTTADSGSTDAGSPPTSAGTFERPFAAARWLYDPIPTNPAIDANSAAMVSKLATGAHIANLHEFGIPFHRASATTPRVAVRCLENWGTCALQANSPRPLTSSMSPHTGSDGAMVVLDDSPRTGTRRGRTSDEYWQYSWNGGNPTTSWGGILDLDGEGVGKDANGVGLGSTAAGVSRAAGVVRAYEIQQGRIDHALVVSTSFCQAGKTNYRYPAVSTDGKYSGAGAVPEGARFQLNPSLNPDTYGLTGGERAVFIALQRYGAYVIDCGGAALAFAFEEIAGDPGAIYQAAGFEWDYYGFNKIPWNQLRVLRSWNGQ